MATIPLDFPQKTVADRRRPAHATQENTTVTLPAWTNRVRSVMKLNPASPIKILLRDGSFASLTDDEMVYLQYESAMRGISLQDVYEEEVAAEKRARAKASNREQLKRIARSCTPDPRHLVVDDDPF